MEQPEIYSLQTIIIRILMFISLIVFALSLDYGLFKLLQYVIDLF